MSIRSEDHSTFIISPHTICNSCGNNSGPKFPLTQLRARSSHDRNNIFLSGAEQASTMNDIANAETELAQLDSEIDQLQHVMDSLRQRRNAVHEFRVQEKSLFAPIRRLSHDVLRHLFNVCQLVFEDDGFIDVYESQTTLRTITKVCAYWRHIAVTSPELWCRIKLCKSESRSCCNISWFLDRCILRSGQMPLYFQFIKSNAWIGKTSMKIIAGCAYRWKDVTFEDGDVLNELTKLYISSAMVLSSLTRLSVSEVSYSNRIILNAPVLSSLTMTEVANAMSTFVDFPWNQITTFDYRSKCCRDGETFASLLTSMTNLTSLTLSGLNTTTISEPVIIFPSLTTLILGDNDNKNTLDMFTAPCLKKLRTGAETTLSSIKNFLNRSCCLITFLELEVRKGQLRELWTECSSSLRCVETLLLHIHWDISDSVDFLTRKATDHQSHAVFPQLIFLQIADMYRMPKDDMASLQHTVDMLKSRLMSIKVGGDGELCFLESVHLSFNCHLKKKDRDFFKEFYRSDVAQQSGLDLTVDHRPIVGGQWVIRDGVVIDDDVELPKLDWGIYEEWI